MSLRHKVRRLALQALCGLDAQGMARAELIHEFVTDAREPPEVARDAWDLARGAYEELESIDRLLARHARHWELKRLAMVDRNILRLALYEMFQGTAPPKVIISEALSLAREFSTAESPRFINGVLDAAIKQVQADITPDEPKSRPGRRAR